MAIRPIASSRDLNAYRKAEGEAPPLGLHPARLEMSR
jgi:hypothetical protein